MVQDDFSVRNLIPDFPVYGSELSETEASD